MRLLMLNHNVAFGGGTFQRAFNLAKRLAPLGHQVTLLAIDPHARLRFSAVERGGVEVVGSPDLLSGIGRTGWDPWDVARRIGYVWRREYDLVYAFDSRPAVVAPALAYQRRHGVPLMMDWADWWGRGGAIGERRFGLINRGSSVRWMGRAYTRCANLIPVATTDSTGRKSWNFPWG